MDVRYDLALVYLKYGRYDEALRECEEMLRRQPASARARRLLQEVKSRQKATGL